VSVVEPVAAPESEEAGFGFDEAFQRKIVSLVWRDDSFASKTAGLIEPGFFENELDGALGKIALDYFAKYRKTPDRSIVVPLVKDAIAAKMIRKDLLPDLKEHLREILGASVSDAPYVTDKVVEFAQNKAMERAILASVDDLAKGDYAAIKKRMDQALLIGADDGEDHDYFARIELRTEERKARIAGVSTRDGITTGYAEIDKYLYHEGWGRKELSCMMGAAKAGKCVTRDTLLLTEDGLVEIGDYVPLDLASGEFKPHKMNILGREGLETTSDVYANGVKPTLKITTGKGYSIEGTLNHPMLVMNDHGNLDWRMLSELKRGDILPLQRGANVFGSHENLEYAIEAAMTRRNISLRSTCIKEPLLPSRMTPELAEFIAMIVAEGYLGERSQIVFTQKCKMITARFVYLAKRLFGLDVPVIERDGAAMMQFTNVMLQAYLQALGVAWVRSSEKVIPKSIRMAPQKSLVSFLNTLLGLEGSVCVRSANKTVFDLTMASERLIQEIQISLLNLGIESRVRQKDGCATNGLRIVRPYWHLTVTGSRNLILLRDKVGLIEERKQAKLNLIVAVDTTARDCIPNAAMRVGEILKEIQAAGISLKSGLPKSMWKLLTEIRRSKTSGVRELTYALAERLSLFLEEKDIRGESTEWLRDALSAGYAYDSVKSIETGEAETVDLCVPVTHSFFANGLISHNSMSLGDFAKNASMAGYDVGLLSCEVASEIIEERIDANVSEILMKKLDENAFAVEEAVKKLHAGAGNFIIKDYASGTLKPSMIRRFMERQRAKGIIIDLLVVDYADICAPEFRSDSNIDNLRSIYIDLRAIAYEYNCAVLTATQTNRAGAMKMTAGGNDVSEDINKSRTVDLMLSINASEAEKAAGEARLFFALSRNGESEFSLRIKQSRGCMKFISKILGRE